MQSIAAIYEQGVFRPLQAVALPESTVVTVIASDESGQINGCATDELQRILERRYDTGETDLAGRIDEHQP